MNFLVESEMVYEGKIQFSNRKLANVVGFKSEKNSDNIIDHLYSKHKWNLSKPKLIISVIGDTKNFKMPNNMKKAFKRGLIKASMSTGSWIITNGLNAGVSKLVGEAISENTQSAFVSDLVLIGILESETVVFKNKLENLKPDIKQPFKYFHKDILTTSGEIYLDSNHTHFIFLNDSVTNSEAKFRPYLEAELRKSKQHLSNLVLSNSLNEHEGKHDIPLIQICVHGDFDTLVTIKQSLKLRIPILILEGSKGCADLIVNAIKQENPDIFKIVADSKILEDNEDSRKNKIERACDHVKSIIGFKNSDLMHIFRLGEDSVDIESAILRAFLNSQKKKRFENLRLATQWNRIDIAKNDILNEDEEFSVQQFSKLLEIALIDNKSEFVQLFLENDANLKNFLTNGRLYYLYNSEIIHEEFKRNSIFYLFKELFGMNSSNFFITFKKVKTFIKFYTFEDSDFSFFPNESIESINNDAKKDAIKKYLNDHYGKDNKETVFLSETEESWLNLKIEKNQELNLFMWSIFFGRIELAKIFWKTGENHMGNALMAASFYQNLFLKNQHNFELKRISNEFSEMAIGVLNLMEILTKEFLIFNYLEFTIPHYDLECLKIANLGKQHKFVACSCVQNLLNKKWNGEVIPFDGFSTLIKRIVGCLSFGLMAPLLAMNKSHKSFENFEKELLEKNEQSDDENINDLNLCNDPAKIKKNKKQNKIILAKYFQDVCNFLHSPSIIFVYDSIAYIIFLCIYSYFLLCDFSYTEMIEIQNFNNQSLNQNFHNLKRYPGAFEYILSIWILTLTIEEIRQFFDGEMKISLKIKLIRYFRDKWNYLDILGCLFFVIGMIFRIVSIWTNEKMFTFAKLFFCLDLTVWYLRLLHVSLVFRSLGPKLVMIYKMAKDLIYFMCLTSIFVCAFGITTEASLYPRSNFDLNLIRRILTKGYWPIYGTIKILEDFDKFFTNCTQQSDCPDPHGIVYSYLALIVYMVIANVLLVNLLIAMFSATFQQVHENSDLIWKFQLYTLVNEYVDAPIFPAPFCLIMYPFEIIKILVLKNRGKRIKKGTETDEFLQVIQDLEKKSAVEYLEQKEEQKKQSLDEILRWNTEKLELLEQKFNNLSEIRLKLDLRN